MSLIENLYTDTSACALKPHAYGRQTNMVIDEPLNPSFCNRNHLMGVAEHVTKTYNNHVNGNLAGWFPPIQSLTPKIKDIKHR